MKSTDVRLDTLENQVRRVFAEIHELTAINKALQAAHVKPVHQTRLGDLLV